MNLRTVALLALIGVAVPGCDLDLQNPNAATREEVLTNIDGVIAAAVGMQNIYAGNIDSYVQAPALVTDEWGTRSLALLAWTSLFTGENFDASFGTAEAPWAASYRVIAAANDLIASAPTVELGPSFTAALVSLGHLYRGMALGQLYLHYERAPIDVEVENPPAVDRGQVLQEALDALEDARVAWAEVDTEELGGFDTRVKNEGFDVENTINAMLARYYLFAGQNQAAIDAADRVDLTVLSVFEYTAPNENPIYDLSFDAAYVAGLQSWVDDAEAGDGRVDFWVDLSAPTPESNTDSALVAFEAYSGPNDDFPVYLPDEMRLIQAEAYTRLNDYPRARDLVNDVRTQATSPVDEPIANLPALTEAELDSEAELLTQIAHERRYELYSQGLRWEDMRRLGEYIANTYTMQFLPIPQQECLANTSISC